MELKKRILSAAILITVLGSGMYLGVKENKENLAGKEVDNYMDLEAVFQEGHKSIYIEVDSDGNVNHVDGSDWDDSDLETNVVTGKMEIQPDGSVKYFTCPEEEPIYVPTDESSPDKQMPHCELEEADGPELESVPEVDYTKDYTMEDFVKENEEKSNTLLVYNNFLEEYGEELGEEDVAYLSTLRDDPNLVAVHGVDGIYNDIDLDDDERWLIVVGENNKIRLSEKENSVFGSYLYDILNFGYFSDVLSDEELENSMPFGEFVSKYDLSSVGYCLPSYGIVEASEEILKEIEEMYGKNVAELVRVKGLPLPYYDYKDIQNVQVLDNKATLELSD